MSPSSGVEAGSESLRYIGPGAVGALGRFCPLPQCLTGLGQEFFGGFEQPVMRQRDGGGATGSELLQAS